MTGNIQTPPYRDFGSLLPPREKEKMVRTRLKQPKSIQKTQDASAELGDSARAVKELSERILTRASMHDTFALSHILLSRKNMPQWAYFFSAASMKYAPLTLASGVALLALHSSWTLTHAEGTTITICVKDSGKVYVVGEGFRETDCRGHDQLLSWNIEGQPGPQ